MIKRLLTVVVLVLALNFLAVAGGVGYLAGTGKLDREKVAAVREVIFPSTAPASQPSTQPTVATSQPTDRLAELLARTAGRPVAEQIDVMQTSFDSQTAQIDRRLRELYDLQDQVKLANDTLAKDRSKFEAEKAALLAQKNADAAFAADTGFQNSLELYKAMPAKRVKEIFKSLDDAVVVRYLQAMDTRMAGAILKEFKTPDETARAQALLERVRLAQAAKESE